MERAVNHGVSERVSAHRRSTVHAISIHLIILTKPRESFLPHSTFIFQVHFSQPSTPLTSELVHIVLTKQVCNLPLS
jgi:hypothetical protein